MRWLIDNKLDENPETKYIVSGERREKMNNINMRWGPELITQCDRSYITKSWKGIDLLQEIWLVAPKSRTQGQGEVGWLRPTKELEEGIVCAIEAMEKKVWHS